MKNFLDNIFKRKPKKTSHFYYYLDKKKKLEEAIEISSLTLIAKGGEGEIYKVSDTLALKIFYKDKISDEIQDKLKYMVDNQICYKGLCWPKSILYDYEENFLGYVMELAKGSELGNIVFQPMILKNQYSSWTKKELIILSLKILDIINELHKNDILIGDINPRNILINNYYEVYFVDTDSYQIANLYKCNVGTVHFTAPEIQGKPYSEFFRTKRHEAFAIATLLFMIFLPGKQPYAFRGCTNPLDNIKNMNFPYPFYNSIESKAPKGPWEFIWNDLSYDMKKSFYSVFKNNNRLSVEEWINIIKSYEKYCDSGNCSIDIFPKINMKTKLKPNLAFKDDIKSLDKASISNFNLGKLILDYDELKFSENGAIIINQKTSEMIISLVKDGIIIKSQNLDLSRIALTKRLFATTNRYTSVRKGIKQSERAILDNLRIYYEKNIKIGIYSEFVSIDPMLKEIAKKHNKNIKDNIKLNIDTICEELSLADEKLHSDYSSIGDLLDKMNRELNLVNKNVILESQIENLVFKRLGLIIYKDFMEYTGIKEITIKI
ncbi:Protein kinase domain-containing protein [Clostridium cavendishii DSM 21758]|uniref:Protein kinase domain-containing protein n=1 Tax=Clostridium cavendishii DSM 21758 TaxID=1121302 RepID=A0A1M6FN02_9CLOT|nr:hypothetical protein [Clostridium cavendishii]SHI99023.1 Protein kinase domain-containing protein [Clostridium cavendishii DSM 21758]